ncbi:hypothetical protein HGRIS_005156 [Hohenbuehelia grisea]|uniref:Carboxylesterase type B domain-containing protein n=1 Tax=Hohenbuehelia grisea TaxID=104357 RepID=A0ABR3JE70_9AGAR
MFNPRLPNLARAVISMSGVSSGMIPGAASYFEPEWAKFVDAIPQCRGLSGNTMNCVREKASATTIFQAMKQISSLGSPLLLGPTIDGPGGILPDHPSRLLAAERFVHMPIISGFNLDEGTMLTPTTVNSTQDIYDYLKGWNSPSPSNMHAFNETVDGLLKLYPDDPSLGSPYNTGNDTFGFSRTFKRLAAILGDLLFIGPQRHANQQYRKAGLNVYGYHFTDPQTTIDVPAYMGVAHSSANNYVYGILNVTAAPSAKVLSSQMIDYWLSFATSLTPNDGRGSARLKWPTYDEKKTILELNGGGIKNTTDNFRAKQIDFINSHAEVLRM